MKVFLFDNSDDNQTIIRNHLINKKLLYGRLILIDKCLFIGKIFADRLLYLFMSMSESLHLDSLIYPLSNNVVCNSVIAA